jgi:hypothetical protein
LGDSVEWHYRAGYGPSINCMAAMGQDHCFNHIIVTFVILDTNQHHCLYSIPDNQHRCLYSELKMVRMFGLRLDANFFAKRHCSSFRYYLANIVQSWSN